MDAQGSSENVNHRPHTPCVAGFTRLELAKRTKAPGFRPEAPRVRCVGLELRDEVRVLKRQALSPVALDEGLAVLVAVLATERLELGGAVLDRRAVRLELGARCLPTEALRRAIRHGLRRRHAQSLVHPACRVTLGLLYRTYGLRVANRSQARCDLVSSERRRAVHLR